MELRINKDLVSHIKLCDFKSENYFYKERLKYPDKLFGLIKGLDLPEGYYYGGRQYLSALEYGDYYSMDEVFDLKNTVRIDGELFEKPKVVIFAGKEKIKTKYFETYLEALLYCKDVFPNVNIRE